MRDGPMTDAQLANLARARCLAYGDLRARHQGKACAGRGFNEADPACSVVGCGCKAFVPGLTPEDGKIILALMIAWRSE